MTTGEPFRGAALEHVRQFLASCGLDYDESISFTAVLREDDEIIATGSLDGSTIKCVAVSPMHQGEDLTGQLLTVLVKHAAQQGIRHLMLYTKPNNQYLFSSLGFHPVIRTSDCLLMENRRNGLNDFLNSLSMPDSSARPVGCIVANCNPFTKGHRYLIETAASECAWVHVFVLSESKGMFTPEERLGMVQQGVSDLPNVLVHPTGPYMVSSATFPSYFLKDKGRKDAVHCEMDVRLFGEKIAPALNITRRYVGTEPFCSVTAQYNARMKALLPGYGIELIEVERKAIAGNAVSASHVRRLIKEQRMNELAALLPESSLQLINAKEGELPCRIPTECKGT